MLEPCGKPLLATDGSRVGVARCLLSQAPHSVTLHERDLSCVANQPTLEMSRGHLGMKLHSQRGAQRERLICAFRCGGKSLRAIGQIKRVAMPMQDGGRLAPDVAQHTSLPGLSQRHWRPTDP